MLALLCLSLFTVGYSDASFMFPRNVGVNIRYYNETNCSSVPVHDRSFVEVCDSDVMTNGHYQCCYNILNKLSVYNLDFDICYKDVMNNTVNYVEYTCNNTQSDSVTLVEVFAIIGLIGLALMGLGIIFFIFSRLFCRRRDDYREL